ncbi:polygalacturonase inhibitor 1-like [Tasmannia lanceolata]|uniref:polygalacturonase inhibitor 1-like n=1 Tax=Tasmannia lanceolata TaxID=3420 RepID=UPI004064A106
MEAFRLSVLLFLLLSSLSSACHPDDKKALTQINNTYHFPSWTNRYDCCSGDAWYGVDCDPVTHRVNGLRIFNDQDLVGQIPPAIGDLQYLDLLLLHKLPNLTGPIPPAIGKLQNLRTLMLTDNSLSGPIPDFLGTMQNLTLIELSFNKFSGSIPAVLANLTKITAIWLDRNQLTGSIPESFGRFQGSVPDLKLSHNMLSGKIPASLGNLDFSDIDFSRNLLEGDASMLFSANKSTQDIDISRNLFEFDFSNVTFPQTLTNLDISHNKIRGNIPSTMTGLQNLQFLNVSYNQLCGEIPQGGKLQDFDSSSYFHNHCLCGSPLNVTCKN